ncbi:MAG: CDP-alcohol phosphatidyltransferase family protein [Actinomycetota bacterium]
MLERIFGAAFKRVIVPIGKALSRTGLSANAVTVLGFLVTLASAYVIATGHHITAGLVLVGGALFDTLDGVVARATGTSSMRGAFLDSTLDRLSDAAIFTGLIWRFTLGSDASVGETAALGISQPGASLALGAMVLAFMVSYVRARAEGLGFECKVGIAERPERIAVVAAGLVFNLLVPALALLALASAVTLVQRFVHVWQQAKQA